MPSLSLFTPDSQLVRQIISSEVCQIMREATILAITACLFLPKYFPQMANTFGHPDACSRVLRILGLEQPDALLARGQSWHPNGMMQAN
jgi:hypothetical protein